MPATPEKPSGFNGGAAVPQKAVVRLLSRFVVLVNVSLNVGLLVVPPAGTLVVALPPPNAFP